MTQGLRMATIVRTDLWRASLWSTAVLCVAWTTTAGAQLSDGDQKDIRTRTNATLASMGGVQRPDELGFPTQPISKSSAHGNPYCAYSIEEVPGLHEPAFTVRRCERAVVLVRSKDGKEEAMMELRRHDKTWQSIILGPPAVGLSAAAQIVQVKRTDPEAQFFIIRSPALNLAFLGFRRGSKVFVVPLFEYPRFNLKKSDVQLWEDVARDLVNIRSRELILETNVEEGLRSKLNDLRKTYGFQPL